MTSETWVKRVNEVFNTEPRLGTSSTTVWLERRAEQKQLNAAFRRRAVHVCLDGPTGVGKTSLAFTHLRQLQIRNVLVQVWQQMTWRDLCYELLIKTWAPGKKKAAEVEVGIDKGLPVGKVRWKQSADRDEAVDQKSRSWTVADVARRLVAEEMTLLVDDLEKASDDLLASLADLCKLLTESHVGPNAKVLLVGTGDVYQRLLRTDPSLHERLGEVSLGTFAHPSDSWRFLTLGFEKLDLFHPANSRFKSQNNMVYSLIRDVYEAADGLPKSLNRLGAEIALEVEGRPGVTASDISEHSRRLAQEHWDQYRQQYPALTNCLRSNDAVFEVIKHLYDEGIGSVHNCNSLILALDGQHARHGQVLDSQQIEDALEELVRLQFLDRTGCSGEVAYCGDPTAAHTLGVVMNKPRDFRGAEVLLRGLEQLELPFLSSCRSVDQSWGPSSE